LNKSKSKGIYIEALKHLKKMRLKKSASEDEVIRSKIIRSISSEATSPEA